jgi:hypothetical protein
VSRAGGIPAVHDGEDVKALGTEAGQLTSAIADWSVQHAQEILAARGEFDERIRAEPAPIR